MNDQRRQPPPDIKAPVRRIGLAWLALVILLLTSLGSAYLDLGAFNPPLGLGIAALKAAIVLWVFMRLPAGEAFPRVASAVALGTLLLLSALLGVDYATRRVEPTAVQPVIPANP